MKALPEPDLRYFSNSNALYLFEKQIYVTNFIGNLPAVAISKGDDFTKWEMIVIPAAPGLGSIWGESTVIVENNRILNISRYGKKALAVLSVSEDHGRTWTASARSNLPMATSKPYAGTLSLSLIHI